MRNSGFGFVGDGPRLPPIQKATIPMVGGVRPKPNSGLYQIQVLDPYNPNRVIWVDAIWDPTRDRLIAIDHQYRDPSDNAAFWKLLTNQFAPGEAVEDAYLTGFAPPAAPGGSSSLVIAVVALIGLYVLMS